MADACEVEDAAATQQEGYDEQNVEHCDPPESGSREVAAGGGGGGIGEDAVNAELAAWIGGTQRDPSFPPTRLTPQATAAAAAAAEAAATAAKARAAQLQSAIDDFDEDEDKDDLR